MGKFYDSSQIQTRINAIRMRSSAKDEKVLTEKERKLQPLNWTWKETFCDFRYRRAAWVGCAGAAF